MKTKKISLKNIEDVLSRDEMKSIMAGSGGWGLRCGTCFVNGFTFACARTGAGCFCGNSSCS